MGHVLELAIILNLIFNTVADLALCLYERGCVFVTFFVDWWDASEKGEK